MAGRSHGSPPIEAGVAELLGRMPRSQRNRLLQLRDLAFDVAASTPGIGPLVESLKWNEPAYRPARARVGTTVRINAVRGSAEDCALYFHCQTTLLQTFRQLYREALRFEGNRAILVGVGGRLPLAALRHCLALAFTYHLRP